VVAGAGQAHPSETSPGMNITNVQSGSIPVGDYLHAKVGLHAGRPSDREAMYNGHLTFYKWLDS